MKPRILLLFIALSTVSSPVWAQYYCDLKLSSTNTNVNASAQVIVRPSNTPQTLMPNETNLLLTEQKQYVVYWVKRRNNDVADTIIFHPEGTILTADASNPKGWLVDKSVPGLYFTLSVNMPPTHTQQYSPWGNLIPNPIYLSTNASINQARPGDGGWGCSTTSLDSAAGNGTMTFSLSFYTTSAFDPAQAAGKILLTSSKLVGTLENARDEGGEFNVYMQGPITISSAGCGAFSADGKVNLGSIPLATLRASPDDVFNETPFQIKLQNCYATPSLLVDLSGNQIKNNLLVNTQGTAKGVGVGLSYRTPANTTVPFYLNRPNLIDSSSLFYTSNYGEGQLNMSAVLGVTDKATLSSGTVDIPAVITLTHP